MRSVAVGLDLARARDDVGYFAAEVLRRPLWDHQREAAASQAFVTAVAAARRTGKTTLIETLAIWTCFREAGARVVILSATQDSSRRVTESIAATLRECSLTRGAVVDDFATRIRLSTGSEIVSLPASQRQVRGYGKRVKLLVIDEAGFVAEDVWRAARYVALDEKANGSRILLAGTPWGGSELFFRRAYGAGLSGELEHASFHWTYRANPLLDHGYLERERERTAPAEYAAEVLGEWSDAAGSLFPTSLLERCTADIELPEWADLCGPARLAAGVDWGESFDRSAAVAIGRLPVAALNDGLPAEPVYGVVGLRVWASGTELATVVDEVCVPPVPWAIVSPEKNGIGAMPAQELSRRLGERTDWLRTWRPGWVSGYFWRPVATTAALKANAYSVLLSLMERGRFVLPRHPDLLRQLAGLRFEQRQRGHVRIEAEQAAVHDDVADALMLATGPRVRDGRFDSWVSWPAARLAVDAPVSECDDLVETGAGMSVPRQPCVQSIDGAELTASPSGAVQTRDERSRLAGVVERALEGAGRN